MDAVAHGDARRKKEDLTPGELPERKSAALVSY